MELLCDTLQCGKHGSVRLKVTVFLLGTGRFWPKWEHSKTAFTGTWIVGRRMMMFASSVSPDLTVMTAPHLSYKKEFLRDFNCHLYLLYSSGFLFAVHKTKKQMQTCFFSDVYYREKLLCRVKQFEKQADKAYIPEVPSRVFWELDLPIVVEAGGSLTCCSSEHHPCI